nr:uncharacterized mitochondrial protein AtMg00820-like [Tanacetum cinerariifolium]
MTGNRALLTNFVKKFLGTVHFGNNNSVVIAGYGDAVIRSMMIKKVYYIKDHLCSLVNKGRFIENITSPKRLLLQKATYLLHMDLCGSMRVKSINGKQYVIVVVDDYSRCYLLNDYGNVGKLKAKKDIGVFVGYSKESTAFRIYNNIEPANVVEALKDVDWFNAMQKELDQFARLKVWRLVPRPEGKTIIKTKWIFKNKKDESSLVIRNKARLVAVGYCQQEGIDYDETFAPDVGKLKAMGDIGVFVGYSKESAAFRIYNKLTRKIHESVNIMKSSTTNVETPINEEVFHEVYESFQGEYSSSSLSNDLKQSPEEVILPQTNTQSIPINMVPNGDEASTSHNVFNERLEDAYFDASTSFHDPSNGEN